MTVNELMRTLDAHEEVKFKATLQGTDFVDDGTRNRSTLLKMGISRSAVYGLNMPTHRYMYWSYQSGTWKTQPSLKNITILTDEEYEKALAPEDAKDVDSEANADNASDASTK